MKKYLIGSLVGGLILFIWQFLSWSMINLHEPAQQYTPKQDALMNALTSQDLPQGGYIIPMPPPTATMDEWKEFMENAEGKPWASIQYHKVMKNDMGLRMLRGLITNFITVFLLCWIVTRLNTPSFSTILLACLFTGLIVFFNVPYTNFIWYENFDIWAHFIDAIVSWTLCGIWLGWWLRRNKRPVYDASKVQETAVA